MENERGEKEEVARVRAQREAGAREGPPAKKAKTTEDAAAAGSKDDEGDVAKKSEDRAKALAQQVQAAEELDALVKEGGALAARLERLSEKTEQEMAASKAKSGHESDGDDGDDDGSDEEEEEKGENDDDKSNKRRPVDRVSSFFNGLIFYRGKKDSLEKRTDGGDGTAAKLTDEELNRVAYPFPSITLTRDVDWAVEGEGEDECSSDEEYGNSQTFQAPNGKHFTVRDLAYAMAKFEPDDDVDAVFFEGIDKVGPHKYWIMWGS